MILGITDSAYMLKFMAKIVLFLDELTHLQNCSGDFFIDLHFEK